MPCPFLLNMLNVIREGAFQSIEHNMSIMKIIAWLNVDIQYHSTIMKKKGYKIN